MSRDNWFFGRSIEYPGRWYVRRRTTTYYGDSLWQAFRNMLDHWV